MTDSADVHPAGLARELADAEADGGWVPLFSERIDGFDVALARAVALARDRQRFDAGDERIGYKLGWTSVAMRTALGIERPNWGTLWTSQLVADRLDITGLHHPKVEPELVAQIGPDRSVWRWCLGLEIVNPRFESYRFDQLDNTADNSSCARVRLGRWVELADDPSEVAVTMSDRETIVAGTGTAVDGGPSSAVRWLADSLAEEGTELGPGDIVFTGGLTAPFDVVSGAAYHLRSTSHPELGEVGLAVD